MSGLPPIRCLSIRSKCSSYRGILMVRAADPSTIRMRSQWWLCFELLTDVTHLRLGDTALHSQSCEQGIDFVRGDSDDVGLHHVPVESLVNPAMVFEDRGCEVQAAHFWAPSGGHSPGAIALPNRTSSRSGLDPTLSRGSPPQRISIRRQKTIIIMARLVRDNLRQSSNDAKAEAGPASRV